MKKSPSAAKRKSPRPWLITALLAAAASPSWSLFSCLPTPINRLQQQVQERRQQDSFSQSLPEPWPSPAALTAAREVRPAMALPRAPASAAHHHYAS